MSEIGFGGHSWNFAKVPDGKGGLRRTTLDEAHRMIAMGLESGVNMITFVLENAWVPVQYSPCRSCEPSGTRITV